MEPITGGNLATRRPPRGHMTGRDAGGPPFKMGRFEGGGGGGFRGGFRGGFQGNSSNGGFRGGFRGRGFRGGY